MSEKDETALPADVLEAVHAGRKIEAIKLLREQRGLDLKESKDMVEAYQRRSLPLPHRRPVEVTGRGTLILLGILILAAYAGYRLLS